MIDVEVQAAMFMTRMHSGSELIRLVSAHLAGNPAAPPILHLVRTLEDDQFATFVIALGVRRGWIDGGT